jgi:hypothetical protein
MSLRSIDMIQIAAAQESNLDTIAQVSSHSFSHSLLMLTPFFHAFLISFPQMKMRYEMYLLYSSNWTRGLFAPTGRSSLFEGNRTIGQLLEVGALLSIELL